MSNSNAYLLLLLPCKTRLQQNSYLPSATWIMQGLGGWSGYKSPKPPGITTWVRGLEQFESTFLGGNSLWANLCVHRSPKREDRTGSQLTTD